MTSPALEIRGLVKTFGTHRAVNDIDLTVRAGTFHGIVGPNGAGKSTTIGMAVGMRSGTARTRRRRGRWGC